MKPRNEPNKWTEIKPNNEMEWNQEMNPGNETNKWTLKWNQIMKWNETKEEPNKWTEMKPNNEVE